MDVDHVLLTRFNLPSTGVEEVIRAREGWLRERTALFERYCLPSVVAQEGERPGWLVYLDPQSPAWLLDRMAEHEAAGLLTPVLRESVSREELVHDLRSVVPAPRQFLITTNLDNDDGIARDFSARLRQVSTQHPRCALYVVGGLIVTAEALYRRTDRVNAFCSVRETWDAPVTAWAAYHNELGRQMPTVRLSGAPGWLQVVHGSNVSNRVRGRRVSPAPYRSDFVGLDVPVPARAEVVADALLRVPARSVRDGARTFARRAALRFLGKERYGNAKVLVARVVRGS
jgi:hypothetical protein